MASKHSIHIYLICTYVDKLGYMYLFYDVLYFLYLSTDHSEFMLKWKLR